LNQLTVSLDFPDERHDIARGIPGLVRRICRVVPELVGRGLNNVVIQTVVKSDNLDVAGGVVDWAIATGARVSVSAYTSAKNGNDAHTIGATQQSALRRLVDHLLALKHSGAPIVSSTFYLQHIPEFFERGTIDGCLAGQKFVTVTPGGTVVRCSESTDSCPYTNWRPGRFTATTCGACWVPCRGESQSPVTWERIRQVGSLYQGSRPRVAPSV
jgi:MoaA/NifB/PqqE/SkfB family radical SAM enzyme